MITYSLTDILTILNKGQKTLFAGFSFWCKAEIHKLKKIGKYYYCELIEMDENKDIKAKIKGIIFDTNVLHNFFSQTSLNVDSLEGLTLLLEGNFSFHMQYGSSIIIKQISPKFTLGDVQQEKKRILAALKKKGISERNKLLPPPSKPYHVALITGRKSQGANDFQSVLEQSSYDITVSLFPGAIHGNQAKQDVLANLEKIVAMYEDGHRFSHLVITRGGGESSGMLRQNDEDIATAICQLPIPVILAIGHTDDRAVLDHIVYKSSKTPTDAAYVLLSDYEHRHAQLDQIRMNIGRLIMQKVGDQLRVLDQMKVDITRSAKLQLEKTATNLQNRHQLISQKSPEKLLQQGYGVIKHDGKYISKKTLEQIEKNDELTIDIYDYTLTLNVVRKIKKDGNPSTVDEDWRWVTSLLPRPMILERNKINKSYVDQEKLILH